MAFGLICGNIDDISRIFFFKSAQILLVVIVIDKIGSPYWPYWSCWSLKPHQVACPRGPQRCRRNPLEPRRKGRPLWIILFSLSPNHFLMQKTHLAISSNNAYQCYILKYFRLLPSWYTANISTYPHQRFTNELDLRANVTAKIFANCIHRPVPGVSGS